MFGRRTARKIARAAAAIENRNLVLQSFDEQRQEALALADAGERYIALSHLLEKARNFEPESFLDYQDKRLNLSSNIYKAGAIAGGALGTGIAIFAAPFAVTSLLILSIGGAFIGTTLVTMPAALVAEYSKAGDKQRREEAPLLKGLDAFSLDTQKMMTKLLENEAPALAASSVSAKLLHMSAVRDHFARVALTGQSAALPAAPVKPAVSKGFQV